MEYFLNRNSMGYACSINRKFSTKFLVAAFGSCFLLCLFLVSRDEYPMLTFKSTHYIDDSPPVQGGLFANLGLQSKPEPSHPVSVLLLTYMRSGSSLTGDILQHSSGAFYVYEPFRSISKKNTSSFTLFYANGTERKPPFSFQKETYDALFNWFTCDISKLPNIGLMDPFLRRGIKSRMFQLCYFKEKAKQKDENTAIRMCAKQLQGICEDSPFRIIKTIRMQLHDIKNLLEDLPNLKIIHLVRDPRAILSSRASIGVCSASVGGHLGCTNYLCKRLENDVLEEEKLIKKYPNRIMSVFYEDIARYPLETSKKLYEFIAAVFTVEAEQYIYNITMAGNKNDCAICTTRSNSSEHIDSWKAKMSPEFLNIVNERCNYVLNRYEFDTREEREKKGQFLPIMLSSKQNKS